MAPSQISAPLTKNHACLTCKTRKVRCDAMKPVCSSCRNSALAQNIDPSTVQCVYPSLMSNDRAAGSSSSRSNKKRHATNDSVEDSRVARLEEKIAQLERALQDTNERIQLNPASTSQLLDNTSNTDSVPPFVYHSSAPESTPSFSPTNLDQFLNADTFGSLFNPDFVNPPQQQQQQQQQQHQHQHQQHYHQAQPHPQQQSQPQQDDSPFRFYPSSPTSNSNSTPSVGANIFESASSASSSVPPNQIPNLNSNQDDPCLNPNANPTNSFEYGTQDFLFNSQQHPLVETRWPTTLPSPHITVRLVKIYFEIPTPSAGVVDESKFLLALSRHPTHPDFPSDYLIHSMCAVATTVKTPNELGIYHEPYWHSFINPMTYHSYHVKQKVDAYVSHGHADLQFVQALVIMCSQYIFLAEIGKMWNYVGIMMRSSPNLSLNNLEKSYHIGYDGLPKKTTFNVLTIPTFADPPVDEADRRERAFTFWCAYVCDRMTCVISNRPVAIPEEDVSTFLPTLHLDRGPLRDPLLNYDALSPQSPVFFTHHPPELVGAQQLFFKAMILFSHASIFMQRNLSRIVHAETRAKAPSDIKRLTGYKHLEDMISSFILSIPPHLQQIGRAENGKIQWHLLMAHLLPRVGTIMLNDPFVRNRPDDSSAKKSYEACSTVIKLLSTAYPETPANTPIEPYLTVLMGIVSRSLIREMGRQKHLGTVNNADWVQAELKMCMEFVQKRQTMAGPGQVLKVISEMRDTGVLPVPREAAEFLYKTKHPADLSSSTSNSSPSSGSQ